MFGPTCSELSTIETVKDMNMRPSIDHSILSPSGHVSKRTRDAALARETSRLFPEGLAAPKFVDTRTDRERLLHQAKELRELAARGMHPRKYAKEAARLEALAAEAL
jgi:hypothetical protein